MRTRSAARGRAAREAGTWWRSVASALLVLGICGVALAACDSPGEADTRANAAENSRVFTALSQLPGVVDVNGGYHPDNPAAGYSFHFFLTVGPDYDENGADSLVDQAIRIMWQSKVHPITGLGVDLTKEYPSGNRGLKSVSYDLLYDRPKLESMYGKRPVSDH